VFDDEYDYCWLIDIGDFQQVAESLPSPLKIKGLFLTHTHFDHISGINKLYENHPKCQVYTSRYGREALFDDRKNFSRYHEMPLTFNGTNVEVLKDNEEIEIYPNTFLKAFSTPGHCPSCLTYTTDNYIFTGDAYIPNVKVVTKLPKGDKTQAQKSTEIILKLAHHKTICPGHGDMISINQSSLMM
jgi:glyoxylase-like metal-dependent hydrolase (beta-lactamase superfamily II)